MRMDEALSHQQKLVALMCNADRRTTLLRFLGEDDMQYLSPTLEDFENNAEEADKYANSKSNQAIYY